MELYYFLTEYRSVCYIKLLEVSLLFSGSEALVGEFGWDRKACCSFL